MYKKTQKMTLEKLAGMIIVGFENSLAQNDLIAFRKKFKDTIKLAEIDVTNLNEKSKRWYIRNKS